MKRSEIKRYPLADSVLSALEPELKEYRVRDSQNLYFRVKPNNRKSWQLRYKNSAGVWLWLGLGNYPVVSAMKARKTAIDTLIKIDNGYEPLEGKKKDIPSKLFKDIANEWLEMKKNTFKNSTYSVYVRQIRKILLIFGDRDYNTITPYEWMQYFKDIETNKGTHEAIKKARQACRNIYDYARVTGRANNNPVSGIEKFLTTKQSNNFPHVAVEQLPRLLNDIKTYPLIDNKIALLLLAMLAVRPSELRLALWSEFDFDLALWTIPPEHTKKSREHLVPLPKQAIKLLDVLKLINGHSPYLLPKKYGEKQKDGTMFTRAFASLGYTGIQTAHGFRHIFSTVLNEQGFNSDHIEAHLAHVKNDVRSVYNKARYLEQRRELLQWYADFLENKANEYAK